MKALLILLFLLLSAIAHADTCQQAVTSGKYPCSVTLTWTDNSNNETEFAVERQLNGGAWNRIGQTAANVATYVDTTLQQSTTADNVYCYQVKAGNMTNATPPALQQSAPSNTACFTVAKFVAPIPVPGVPTALKVSMLDKDGNVISEIIVPSIALNALVK